MRSKLAFLALLGLFQTPTFEVASLKPTTSLSGVSGGCRGRDGHFGTPEAASIPLGRCVITAARVSHLISIAYHLDVNRVSGDPHWSGSDRFDVEAKAESSVATLFELRQMLQQLLADRFKLKLQSYAREVPGFALVIAKNGPKLKEAQSSDESRLIASGGKVRKGNPDASPNLNTIIGSKASLEDLAELLSRPARGEIIDKTGLRGL
jgi:uncharacterized protein (TIGR03435 family)